MTRLRLSPAAKKAERRLRDRLRGLLPDADLDAVIEDLRPEIARAAGDQGRERHRTLPAQERIRARLTEVLRDA